MQSLTNYHFFTELEQKFSQFWWKHERPPKAKVVLRKKKGAGGINLSDFRLYYRATVIKIVWYWHKNRNIDQWNKTASPEINLCKKYGYILDQGGKNIQWGKESLFSKWCWENWTALHRRMKLEYFLTSHTKINSKWIKRTKSKERYHKTLRGKHRQTTPWHKSQQDPLWPTSQSNGNKNK